ncbi:hypothetical protein [Polymorphobacter megasporae]|uniref:hypothetical protein n=1 Tax=Glacieibacterium megasporae TaxID=2835787 RepID=UPI001C1E5711|nr:hypothetical protein [Polymorphobacter megasporae]UAJ12684.1 hypothetical protein KTC28_19230 [Polymorphobacter megasporae]
MKNIISLFGSGRLAGQSLVAFGFRLLGAAVSFALSWMIARRFGPQGSGLFGLAASTIQFLGYVAIGGLDVVVVRAIAGNMRVGKDSEARGSVVSCFIIVLVISVSLSTLLHKYIDIVCRGILHSSDVIPLMQIMFWSVIPVSLARLASATLRAHQKVAISQFIDGPAQTGFVVIFVAIMIVIGGRLNLVDIALASLIGVTLTMLFGWYLYANSSVSRGPKDRISTFATVAAGIPILVAAISNSAVEWLSNVLIAENLSTVDVGVFRTAWQIVALLGLVQVAFDSIIGPRLAALWKVGDLSSIAIVSTRMSLLAMGLASPVVFAIMIFPQDILGLFGHKFVIGSSALQVLVVGQIIRLASGPLGSILVMSGSRLWVYLYSMVNIATFLIVSHWLIGGYGLVGASAATVITICVRGLFTAIVVRLRLGVPVFDWHILRRALTIREVVSK